MIGNGKYLFTSLVMTKIRDAGRVSLSYLKLQDVSEGLWNIAGNLGWADIDFTADYSANREVLKPGYELDANAICSKVYDDDGKETGLHKVVLDIDMEAVLIPSSTDGHYHLLIDRMLTWGQYKSVLEVLGSVGLVEPGYVNAAKERGATWIRTPWTTKQVGDKTEQEGM